MQTHRYARFLAFKQVINNVLLIRGLLIMRRCIGDEYYSATPCYLSDHSSDFKASKNLQD